MKGSLDRRLDSLERVYGGADEPPIMVVFHLGEASEADVQAAIRQALEGGPGEPTFSGQRLYVVKVTGGESGGQDEP
jgi:hypothetical protein